MTRTKNPSSSSLFLLNFQIIGDVFVDIICYLENDWPVRGGDANLIKPVTTMAGGSALNTATHLNSLSLPLRSKSPPNNQDATSTTSISVTLQSSYNPSDQYGQMIVEHAKKYKFPLTNCLKIQQEEHQQQDNSLKSVVETSIPSTGHCICIVAKGDRSFMTHNGAMVRCLAFLIHFIVWPIPKTRNPN